MAMLKRTDLEKMHPAYVDGLKAGAFSVDPRLVCCPYASGDWERQWRYGFDRGRHCGMQQI